VHADVYAGVGAAAVRQPGDLQSADGIAQQALYVELCYSTSAVAECIEVNVRDVRCMWPAPMTYAENARLLWRGRPA
jgi:hypothetical protein